MAEQSLRKAKRSEGGFTKPPSQCRETHYREREIENDTHSELKITAQFDEENKHPVQQQMCSTVSVLESL